MKLEKYKLWLAFFIAIFTMTFSMIIWTVYNSIKAEVHEDRSFLSSYHKMDDEFNNIVNNNRKFLEKYDAIIDINGHKTSLDIKDIYLSQRVLKKKPTHKDFLKLGKNNINIILKSKDNSKLPAPTIELLITRSTTNTSDIILRKFTPYIGGRFNSSFNIKDLGNWNITGKISIANHKGYIYIKTNVKQ